MNSRSFIIRAILVTACMGLSAQPGPPPHRGPEPFALLRKLDLTEAQQKSIRSILDKHRASSETLRETALSKGKALREAAMDPSTSDAQLRSLHTEASAANLQMLLEEHAAQVEIQSVLTPQQQAKAKELRQKQQEEMVSHGERGEGPRHGGPDFGPQPRGPEGPDVLPFLP